jgi:hypothetical protein
MSTTCYSTAFAHLVSAGASLGAIRASGTQNFPRWSFGTFLINSALGILTFGELENFILWYPEICGILLEFFL